LDRPDRELGSAGRVGRVDLVLGLARDLGERVAGYGELAEVAPTGSHQHQRVRAVRAVIAAGARRLAALHVLDAAHGFGLVRTRELPGADVGADHEDRLRA